MHTYSILFFSRSLLKCNLIAICLIRVEQFCQLHVTYNYSAVFIIQHKIINTLVDLEMKCQCIIIMLCSYCCLGTSLMLHACTYNFAFVVVCSLILSHIPTSSMSHVEKGEGLVWYVDCSASQHQVLSA